MAADGRVNGAGILPEAAADDTFIHPAQAVILQLGGKGLMGKVVLRHDEQSAGIHVNAVDDAGPLFAVDAGEGVAAVVQQGVDQGAVLMARRRMDHQALGLIDDQNVPVLVDHVQGNVLGHKLRLADLRQEDVKLLTGLGLGVFLHGPAAARHAALLQQPLDGAAGQLRQGAGKEHVHPLTALLSRPLHAFSRGRRTKRRPAALCSPR